MCCVLALHFIHALGSRHSNCRERSNRYVACTKLVRFRGLALLDVLSASTE